ANAREGAPTALVAVDPAPRVELPPATPGLTRVERADCRAVPEDLYLALGPGDVLFVDTWHVVKLGSEVNWIVLDLLPRLAPGVWVHFHDVFLPYEYPRWMFTTAGYVNEQYLLEALLLGGGWRVEIAMAALFHDRHPPLLEAIPSLREAVPGAPELRTWPPSAFWLRRDPAGYNAPLP
ncbi:MAG TPA: class I SAM-dependent methyltransferase, partial [Solirubrobacteraceae bacterium]